MRPRVLKSQAPEFKKFLAAILARRGSDSAGIDAAVSKIIADVRNRGDRALIDLTAKFDRVKLTSKTLRVTPAERQSAINHIPPEDRRALELAAERIAEFHRRTMEKSFIYRDKSGMRLGQMVQPMRRVGIYVPGGLGAYPSSVLMNAIPAKVAGVAEIVMVSPPSSEGERLAVLAAAEIAGVDEFYRVGGAHAVAALAYGTETIKPVDKIVGPGNAYVQAAKRMVYGVADIDKMAGPSEVLVIADERANPEWIAADLIAQAEHGSGDEAAVLLTPSESIANRVAEAIETALKTLPRARQVEAALVKRGAMVVVSDLNEAFDLANQIGPEHLELDLRNPSRWLPKVKAAGAVFLGLADARAAGRLSGRPKSRSADGGSRAFCVAFGCIRFPETNQYNRGVEGRDCGARAYGRASGADGRVRGPRTRNGTSERHA